MTGAATGLFIGLRAPRLSPDLWARRALVSWFFIVSSELERIGGLVVVPEARSSVDIHAGAMTPSAASRVFGDEDDLARDTAGLGVAQRGGSICEGEATGDLGRDGPLRQAVENLTKVATQLGTVASGP